MIDFSKIFDIVFASVALALILFLLASAIAVAARGKRKCNGFDVALRIASTLVLIVAAVMFAAAILTMLDGSFRIMLESPSAGKTVAYLVINGKQTELPFVDLFTILSSVVGSNLVAVLLVCALAALVVDCLVANKKDDKTKAKASKPQKTPEQLKREAELERIKRIGESAVRKADAAASQDAPIAQAQDDEPHTDWREEPKPQERAEFVGIKDDAYDFDSFDDVDRDSAEVDGSAQDAPEAEQDRLFDEERPFADDADAGEAIEDDANGEEALEEEAVADEEFTEDEIVDQDDFQADEPVDGQDTTDNREVSDEQAETLTDERPDEDDMSGWAFESDGIAADEQPEQAEQAEQAEQTEQVEQAEQAEETHGEADDGAPKEPELDIEPDRNIYIPEMRTIEPAPQKAVKSPKRAKPKAATAKPKKPATDARRAVPPEKKLPVTRKYVILDRHNAVNMFGEYLKERNKAQKEKLESSIDTIIIE